MSGLHLWAVHGGHRQERQQWRPAGALRASAPVSARGYRQSLSAIACTPLSWSTSTCLHRGHLGHHTARRWMGGTAPPWPHDAMVNSPATSASALTAASRGRPRGMIADATGENQLKLSRSESNWEEVVVSLARTRPYLGLIVYTIT